MRRRQPGPIERLREAVRWFVGVPELRLLHAHVATDLRLAALIEIAKGEERFGNRSLFVLLDAPAEQGPPDWDIRREQLDELMAARRAQAAEQGVTMPAPARRPEATGLEGFAGVLRGHLESLPPERLDGLVVVLAPSPLVQADAWATDLRALLHTPLLQRARYIVVEDDPAPGRAVAQELGSQAETVDVQPAPTANRELLSLRLAGMKSAPVGAMPERLVGMAGPREAPPPRLNAPKPDPSLIQAELQAAGAPPALANQELMQGLRVELTSVMLAQEVGDVNATLQHQTRARDLAIQSGLTEHAAILDLMLGTQLLQGGSASAALRHFDGVVENARVAGLPKIEAQAHLARASVHLREQRPEEAGKAYLAGAAAAEKADVKPIAVECYRMIGQLWLSLGRPVEAAQAFLRAIATAQAGPPEQIVATSAPQAARQLAELYRGQGMRPQADSLEAQAAQWEQDAKARAAAIEAAEAGEAPPPTQVDPQIGASLATGPSTVTDPSAAPLAPSGTGTPPVAPEGGG